MKVTILSEDKIARKLKRMAYEIWEQNSRAKELVLLGIEKGGAVIAENLKTILTEISPLKVVLESIKLDKKNVEVFDGGIDTDVKNKPVILVDDVANSGKTLLYAIKPLLAQHPGKIQIAVLVDRQHKNFPIKPDFIGYSIATTLQEHIEVTFENNTVTGAYVQ